MRNLLAIWCAGIAVVGGALGRSANTQSAAALPGTPENRGKVVGARCQRGDGYQADWSAITARAAQAATMSKLPVNVLDYRDPKTPAPVDQTRLPSHQVYCLSTLENPEGYFTSNCRSD